MAAYFQLKVVTPQGAAYAGTVRHARIPVENGSVGILAHHAPYVTSSAGGICTVEEQSGKQKAFVVGPGFFTVASNEAAFLTQSFQETAAGTS